MWPLFCRLFSWDCLVLAGILNVGYGCLDCVRYFAVFGCAVYCRQASLMFVFLAAGHLVCLSICRILLAFLFLAFCIWWVQWLCYGLSPSV